MSMKYVVLALCVLLGTSHAVPVQAPQTSVQEFFNWLELLVQHEGKEIVTKAVTLMKHLEDGIQRVKEIIPAVNKKLHEDADQVLVELEEITNELKALISTKDGDVYHGYGILDDLTNMAGGFRLSTAIRLLKLASSVSKVCHDAKELEPKFVKELGKIQNIIHVHTSAFMTQVFNELGKNKNKAQQGIAKDLKDVFEQLDEKFWELLVDLIEKVEDSVQRVKDLVPKIYTKIHEDADRVLNEIKKVTDLVKDHLSNKKGVRFGILDDLSELTGGFKLSTAMRVLQLAESAHKVCQDAKQFEPKLEKEFVKIQGILEKHVTDFTKHIVNELGLGDEDIAQKGIVKDIEDLFEIFDEMFYKLVIDLLKQVESGIERVKEMVPKVHEKIHKEADKVLNELREITKSLKNFISKEIGDNIYYGNGILDDLTEMAGGFKLSTALRVLQLAESAHKVCQDAKQFEPKLEKELNKIQDIIQKHITEFSTHVINEFGLGGKSVVQSGIVKDIENLFEDIDELFYKLALDLLKQVESGIERVKEIVPKVHEVIHEEADKVLIELKEITKSLKNFISKEIGDVYYGYGILDDLTDIAGGFKLSTAMRVLQLAESAHKVCQDAKEFEPKLEKELGKIQGILEKHAVDLASHVVKELGVFMHPMQQRFNALKP